MDLFINYDKQPKKLAKIVSRYVKKYLYDSATYKDTNAFLKDINAIGYTFEYGLDNVPYNLKKL